MPRLRTACCLGLCSFLLLLAAPARAQAPTPPGPAWQTIEEAVASASESGKKILLSVYAPWCGWCRKLDTEVYPNEEVLAYLEEHFVLARVDGDDPETKHRFKGYHLNGPQLAQAFGANGFPTTIFLEADGEYINRLPGYADADVFLEVLRYIGSEAYDEMTFEDYAEQEAGAKAGN